MVESGDGLFLGGSRQADVEADSEGDGCGCVRAMRLRLRLVLRQYVSTRQI